MSAAPPRHSAAAPPSDVVNVEVDGKPCQGKKGQMIIHVTDAQNAYVPRFCYHDKLPIAANCRMCLVEVEKAPKPLPACATPITEGMKIFTKTPKAIGAQKATMEFLLINHPLDCPICDQGGECELQDLAMGFGRDVGAFQRAQARGEGQGHRSAGLHRHDALHPLHALRALHPGDRRHPGARHHGPRREHGDRHLRRARRRARALGQHHRPVPGGRAQLQAVPLSRALLGNDPGRAGVAARRRRHQSSTAHVLRGRLMRVVPRPNEAINETWIADRDRYSYEGIYSADRLEAPMVREGGEWKRVELGSRARNRGARA